MAKKWTAQIIIETTGTTQDEARSNLEDELMCTDVWDMKNGATLQLFQCDRLEKLGVPTTIKKTFTLTKIQD